MESAHTPAAAAVEAAAGHTSLRWQSALKEWEGKDSAAPMLPQ